MDGIELVVDQRLQDSPVACQQNTKCVIYALLRPILSAFNLFRSSSCSRKARILALTGANKTVIWHKTQHKNIRYKIIKAIKRTHQVQLHNKNADRSARLTVLLRAASELKSTVAGKLFHTFTILYVTVFDYTM